MNAHEEITFLSPQYEFSWMHPVRLAVFDLSSPQVENKGMLTSASAFRSTTDVGFTCVTASD